MILPAAPTEPAALALGLSVALGGGLLIGLERERRKGQGPGRAAAGIRSFTLVALAGALARGLGGELLVALGGLAVLLLAAIAYAHSLRARAGPKPGARMRGRGSAVEATLDAGTSDHRLRSRPSLPSPGPDPGMTTELALLVTYLVGVLAMQQPALGAGAAALVAALLAARGHLHQLATQVLSEDELHDGLLLAALALVLVPLVPATPLAWLGGVAPRQLAALVLLILLLQAAGHVALRWLGPGTGLALSGLISGFVSSTATVAALGSRARARPAEAGACRAGAVMSTAATWLQGGAMLAALAPALATRMAPSLAVGALVAAGCGGWLAWHARQAERAAAQPAGAEPAAGPAHRPAGGALRVREALLVALLLTAVTAAVAAASRWLGPQAALASAALAGVADAHSGIGALAALAAGGQLGLGAAATGVLVTVAANSVSRSVVAGVSGGAGHARAVALSLVASLAAASAAAWATGALRP